MSSIMINFRGSSHRDWDDEYTTEHMRWAAARMKRLYSRDETQTSTMGQLHGGCPHSSCLSAGILCVSQHICFLSILCRCTKVLQIHRG